MTKLKKEGNKHIIDCICGKTYIIKTNVYDNSNSGCGRCECGKCVTHIN